MGDIAKCSVGSEDKYYNEDLLYDMFGVNAELLIDHAWGYEPCTMKHIKAYVIGDTVKELDLYVADMTAEEREIVKAGCLINYYAK